MSKNTDTGSGNTFDTRLYWKLKEEHKQLKKQAIKDRDWLKEIIKAYDPTAVTVPTEFDSKIAELRLYLEKSEDGSISTS